MFQRQIDMLAVGDITTDAFIRLKDAHVNCKINNENCELCVRFGDKVPFEYVKVVKAVGNAANAAVAAARLGLRSALVANIGTDQNGRDCLAELQRNTVVTSLIKIHKNKPTNYHFVLWYDVDRTILVNHTEFDYRLPAVMHERGGRRSGLPPKWIYLTSLAANTLEYHLELADYLKKNPSVKLAFQPGTFQMKLGFDQLKDIYERTDLFVVNVEEAQRILNTDSRDVKMLMKSLHEHGPKLVAVTDNTNGAYLFDGDHHYHIPMYPDPRPAFERTGCGDAWASTFVSALAMGKTPLEALVWAPVNPMSVAQFIGAQEGLLSLDQLEWWLNRAPADFKPKEI
ncbi:MAG: carbohydrate kinase family protein [Patescibacteria group bacterium]|nr:carbohydrate kinase family protein [Patescibacteria group bacterium]MDE2172330.1 carbohydrate kinase family protein [Patescibacteria group bacterium]